MMTTCVDELHIDLEASSDAEWARLLAYLPPDLEDSARQCGALRRKRQIRSASDLLRLTLAYACGASLDTLAARATELQIVEHVSDNALHERFARLTPWISYLIGQMLASATRDFPWGVPLRVRVLDASGLERPGATGTDWRLHLGIDLRTGLIDHLAVTGDNLGERLADFPIAPGEVVLADRGYASRHGLASLHARGGASLIRLNWSRVPLQYPDGRPVDLATALRSLAPGQQAEWAVATVPTGDLPAVPGRLVACALTEDQASAARRKVRQTARKKGQTLRAETLLAAGYVLLFTTVPATVLTCQQVVALYRLRWQVEVTFKRGKSALRLADIRATTDRVCYTVVLAKCLLLLLLDRLAWATGFFPPSGDACAAREPLSTVSGVVGDGGADSAPAPDAAGLVLCAIASADALVFGPPTAETHHAA